MLTGKDQKIVNGAAMETPWREWLKKAKIVYWLIMGGLAASVLMIILGTMGIISSEQVLELGRWYTFLLIAGTALQMIARRLVSRCVKCHVSCKKFFSHFLHNT